MWTCRGKGQRGLKHSWVKFRNRSLTLFPRSRALSCECPTTSPGSASESKPWFKGHMPLAEGAVTLRWLMDVGGFP